MRSKTPPSRNLLLEKRVSPNLVPADFVFPFVDLPSPKVFLHSILLILQMQLITLRRAAPGASVLSRTGL